MARQISTAECTARVLTRTGDTSTSHMMLYCRIMGKGACWKDRQREIAGEDGQHRIAVVDGECLADVNAGITDPGPVDALKAALGYSGNPYLDPSVPFDAERSAAIGIEPVQIPPLPQTEEPQG